MFSFGILHERIYQIVKVSMNERKIHLYFSGGAITLRLVNDTEVRTHLLVRRQPRLVFQKLLPHFYPVSRDSHDNPTDHLDRARQ